MARASDLRLRAPGLALRVGLLALRDVERHVQHGERAAVGDGLGIDEEMARLSSLGAKGHLDVARPALGVEPLHAQPRTRARHPLLARIAAVLEGGLVDVEGPSVQVGDGHRQRVGVEGLGEAALALAQRGLGADAGGDVDQRREHARPPVDVDEVGVGDGHDLLAALRPESRLHVADGAPLAEVGEAALAKPGIHPESDLGNGHGR